jgi:23S rRNA (guanosine2251-2'-O)-methyltransferase
LKEYLYSRNAVFETLRAARREVFRILLAEGVQEKGRLQQITALAQNRRIPVERLPRPRLDKINPGHQGVVAEAGAFAYADLLDILEQARHLNEPPMVLLLDSLQDPQNFGALLRTAEAAGVHGVVIPLAHTVEVTPAVVNASSGASEHLRIARLNLAQAIDTLKAENIWIVGLDQAGQPLSDPGNRHLQGALGLVVGSEGEGLRQLVRSKCDLLIRLPMGGQVESLNAAVAGSIALYLAYLARHKQ